MIDARDDRQARAWSAVLKAICAGPVACASADLVAAAIGKDPRRVLGQLRELEAAGWVCPWELPGIAGPCYTLSPGAAARLAVRLDYGRSADDECALPRWVPEGSRERSPRAGPLIPPEPIDWDLVLDLRPLDLAEAWAERDRRLEAKSEPTPALLIGLRPAWPVAECDHAAELPPSTYCLACDAYTPAPPARKDP